MKKRSTERKPEETVNVPVYLRPCRRGGEDGKREITITSLSTGYDSRRIDQRVPYIRMSGAWLQRLGFERGHRIEITAERERLVLTVVPDDSELPVN